MAASHDARAVRSAILRESLSYLAHGLLYPLASLGAKAEPIRSAEIRTVVFVHGLAANRSSFLPLQTYLRWYGYERQYSIGYRSRGSLEGLALELKRRIDENVRGGRIDIVAHSMGGLLSRFYIQCLGGDRRIDRLITLGTPHGGTHAANFVPAHLVRQLLPDSSFIEGLNAQPVPPALDMTSIIAGRDLLVQPVQSARCPFGDAITFPEMGHLELLFSWKVFEQVRSQLSKPVSFANSCAQPSTGSDRLPGGSI